MKKLLMSTGFGLSLTIAVMAQKAPTFNTGGIAVHGYDAVAFFTEKKPVKGSEQFAYTWQNTNWLFASQ